MEIYIRKGKKKIHVEKAGIGKSKARIKSAAKALREAADALEGDEKKQKFTNEIVIEKT